MSSLIYLAGPITLPDPPSNTHFAIQIADALVSAGFTPFVPHLSTLWQTVKPHSHSWWIEYDLRVIDNCAIVVRIPGPSQGADIEVSYALQHGIPVLHLESQEPEEAVEKLTQLSRVGQVLAGL
jgi:nucleoside 2-deoxyribosyltransferase